MDCLSDEIFLMEHHYRILHDDKVRTDHDNKIRFDRCLLEIHEERRKQEELSLMLTAKTN